MHIFSSPVIFSVSLLLVRTSSKSVKSALMSLACLCLVFCQFCCCELLLVNCFALLSK